MKPEFAFPGALYPVFESLLASFLYGYGWVFASAGLLPPVVHRIYGKDSKSQPAVLIFLFYMVLTLSVLALALALSLNVPPIKTISAYIFINIPFLFMGSFLGYIVLATKGRPAIALAGIFPLLILVPIWVFGQIVMGCAIGPICL